MNNPFSFAGKGSLEKDFIGRQREIRFICDRVLHGAMTCIVGLPRMGKTSLVHHIFLDACRPVDWQREHSLIPLYIDLSTCADAEEFWWTVASRTKAELTNVATPQSETNAADRLNAISKLDEADQPDANANYIYIKVKESLDILNTKCHLRFIFIIDELDALWKYHYSKVQFSKLRELSTYGVLITCSRRTPEHIEQMAFGTRYLANMAVNRFVGPFLQEEDVKEVTEYWEHFHAAFDTLGKEDFENYKKLVERYAGRHPHLMNLMNEQAVNSGNIVKWHQALSSKRYQVEWQFRTSLVSAFEEQLHYLQEQKLKKTAIAAVLGGKTGQGFENKLAILQKYSFLKMVTADEKRAIFLYDLGLVTGDNKHRYVCLSNFFSHYLRDNYNPSYKDSELLKVTELKLRELIRWFLKAKFGTDALDIQTGDEYSDNYEEQWEQLYKEDRRKRGNPLYTNEEQEWAEIRRRRLRLMSNDCKPLGERPRIDWLMGTTLMNLWDFFVNCYWVNFFRNVFVTEVVIGSYDYAAEKRNWRNYYFEPLHRLRNGNAHYNDEIFTEDSVTKARVKCRQICEAIDNWMARKGDEMMEE